MSRTSASQSSRPSTFSRPTSPPPITRQGRPLSFIAAIYRGVSSMSRTQVWSQIPRWNWQTHSLPSNACAGMGQRLEGVRPAPQGLPKTGLARAPPPPAEQLGSKEGVKRRALHLPLAGRREFGFEVIAPQCHPNELDELEDRRLDPRADVERARLVGRLRCEERCDDVRDVDVVPGLLARAEHRRASA